MKLKHIITAAALATTMVASSAQAITLDLTSMLSFSESGFRTSLVHDQNGNAGNMSGSTIAMFDSFLTGTYDSDTGAIAFSGAYDGGSSYTASGNLSLSGSRTAGVFGDILFDFTGGALDGESLSFNFLDQTFNDDANKFASGNAGGANAGLNFIGLWGSSCSGAVSSAPTCYGIDLRIAHDGGPNGATVPLPASAFLLLAGLGGLGATRKLRKKA